jgi:hypothetical protein
MDEILTNLHDLRVAREQIETLMSDHPDEAELHTMGEAAVTEIGAWEARITQLKHETYEDEDAWETMLAGQLRFLMDVIDRTGAPVTDGAMTRLADLKAEWQTRQGELRRISEERIGPINSWAKQQGVAHVRVP